MEGSGHWKQTKRTKSHREKQSSMWTFSMWRNQMFCMPFVFVCCHQTINMRNINQLRSTVLQAQTPTWLEEKFQFEIHFNKMMIVPWIDFSPLERALWVWRCSWNHHRHHLHHHPPQPNHHGVMMLWCVMGTEMQKAAAPRALKRAIFGPKRAQIGSKLKIVGNLSCDLSKFAQEDH